MMHSRRMSVVDVTAEELVHKLASTTWCPCNGFRIAGTPYYFLNDSTSPDGAQEFAVCKDDMPGDQVLVQIESITASWMLATPGGDREFGDLVSDILMGKYDGSEWKQLVPRHLIETPEQHGRCPHCA